MKELFIGIDWSQDYYDVTILAASGAILTQFQIAKSIAGFQQLAEKIDKLDMPVNQCLVGLETAHNILIDFLWTKGYSVYVVAPSIVNSSRGLGFSNKSQVETRKPGTNGGLNGF